MVSDFIQALVTSDAALAQRVISEDTIMDATEREIGDKAILMIAKRQPVASDLREIIGSIRIASDLERVGDLGKSNAKRVIAVQSAGIPRPLARGIRASLRTGAQPAQGCAGRLFQDLQMPSIRPVHFFC